MSGEIETSEISQREVKLPDDEPLLKQLFFKEHLEDPALLALDDFQRQSLIEMQYRAQITEYDQSYPDADHTIISQGDNDIGRLLIDRYKTEIHCIDINILSQYRNRGIGTDILRRLLRESADSDRVFVLRVLKTNPAVNLYKRLGIEIVSDEGVYWKMEWRERLDDSRITTQRGRGK